MKAQLLFSLFTTLLAKGAPIVSGPPIVVDRLAFVYEVVRHGARAPLADEPPGYFQVPTEQLTASGMRQRYLLGRRNRQRYVEQYRLLDASFNPNQILAICTPVARVI